MSKMKRAEINDEVLSAYMDGELDAGETLDVRDAIEKDPALGERLAALTAVDALVRKHAHALDRQPMPAHVLRRLEEQSGATETAEPESRVIHVDFLRRGCRYLRTHAAAAACLVLALGVVVLVVGRMDDRGVPAVSEYASALANSTSGDNVMLDESNTLVTRFSFRDESGRFCRQYRLQTPDQSTENVACRNDDGWVVVASLDATLADGGEYRPASQLPAMESLLDDMMAGAPLSLAEERQLIRNDWRAD